MAKINFINSGAVDIIRTAYYILGLELMKLIFAILDVSLTMGLTYCYKTEGFFTFIYYYSARKLILILPSHGGWKAEST